MWTSLRQLAICLWDFFPSLPPRFCTTVNSFQWSSWREESRLAWTYITVDYLKVPQGKENAQPLCLEGKEAHCSENSSVPTEGCGWPPGPVVSNRGEGLGITW